MKDWETSLWATWNRTRDFCFIRTDQDVTDAGDRAFVQVRGRFEFSSVSIGSSRFPLGCGLNVAWRKGGLSGAIP
jgi:hypothetical protein